VREEKFKNNERRKIGYWINIDTKISERTTENIHASGLGASFPYKMILLDGIRQSCLRVCPLWHTMGNRTSPRFRKWSLWMWKWSGTVSLQIKYNISECFGFIISGKDLSEF